MATYISILRGINVSGKNLIKMDALKKMYEGLHFKNVKTYIQSGNVIFSTQTGEVKKIADKIVKQIKNEFGFDVPVIVLTVDKLREIIQQNPFINDKQKDIACLHVTFLKVAPNEFDKKSIEEKKSEGEEIEFGSDAVYLYCPGGYGQTKLNNNFLENKLKVDATTRNWKTANVLLEMAYL
ncbi:MAG: DUF1697 domain-containing protein [Bacteroidetes bacterium]|nr:DUF1697 domain-containing protein [Bacteroidota bacterium]